MRICIFLFFFLFQVSCSGPSRLDQVLSAAGDNRAELEKVLKHYGKNPGDSLKLRAAEFLIENMPVHGFYSGPAVDLYYRKTDSLFSLGARRVPDLKEQLDGLFEETRKQSVSLAGDLQHIKASFLISRIEQAFATRQHPWSNRLSFADFCEYILPYRLVYEPPEEWWSACYARFSPLVESNLNLGVTSDSVICRQIVSAWPKRFRDLPGARYDLPPSVLLKMEVGTCPEFAQLGVYAMRTFGIPVVYDFTPHWGNRSLGHEWNSLLYNGRAIPFQLGDNAAFGEHLSKRADKLAKVYRKTFSPQSETLIMQRPEEDIPPLFRNSLIKDVSEMYFRPRDVEIELSVPAPAKKKIAYIMVFDNQRWVPIHWARIKKNKAVFTRMAEECAYTVMYYHAGTFHPASQAFYIDTTGKVGYFEPNMNVTEEIVLKRKHPELGSQLFKKLMVGGIFQGANRPDFSDAVVIHTIDSLPEAAYNFVELETPCCYRYFRYVAPRSSYVNVAEIEFFDEAGEQLQGEIIGTDGSYENLGNDKYKAFDGNTLTYFNSSVNTGGWMGMDMKKKACLKRIIYLPRNDDNFIREGEVYELFYRDLNGRVSLGKQTGSRETQKLVYRNVPTNALFLLRNLTRGTEERIFTYKDGKQVWW